MEFEIWNLKSNSPQVGNTNQVRPELLVPANRTICDALNNTYIRDSASGRVRKVCRQSRKATSFASKSSGGSWRNSASNSRELDVSFGKWFKLCFQSVSHHFVQFYRGERLLLWRAFVAPIGRFKWGVKHTRKLILSSNHLTLPEKSKAKSRRKVLYFRAAFSQTINSSTNAETRKFFAGFAVVRVNRANQTRIERTGDVTNFDRIRRIGNRTTDKSRFNRTEIIIAVTRTDIPSRRRNDLIILDFAAFNFNPMTQRAANRFGCAPTACRLFRSVSHTTNHLI